MMTPLIAKKIIIDNLIDELKSNIPHLLIFINSLIHITDKSTINLILNALNTPDLNENVEVKQAMDKLSQNIKMKQVVEKNSEYFNIKNSNPSKTIGSNLQTSYQPQSKPIVLSGPHNPGTNESISQALSNLTGINIKNIEDIEDIIQKGRFKNYSSQIQLQILDKLSMYIDNSNDSNGRTLKSLAETIKDSNLSTNENVLNKALSIAKKIVEKIIKKHSNKIDKTERLVILQSFANVILNGTLIYAKMQLSIVHIIKKIYEMQIIDKKNNNTSNTTSGSKLDDDNTLSINYGAKPDDVTNLDIMWNQSNNMVQPQNNTNNFLVKKLEMDRIQEALVEGILHSKVATKAKLPLIELIQQMGAINEETLKSIKNLEKNISAIDKFNEAINFIKENIADTNIVEKSMRSLIEDSSKLKINLFDEFADNKILLENLLKYPASILKNDRLKDDSNMLLQVLDAFLSQIQTLNSDNTQAFITEINAILEQIALYISNNLNELKFKDDLTILTKIFEYLTQISYPYTFIFEKTTIDEIIKLIANINIESNIEKLIECMQTFNKILNNPKLSGKSDWSQANIINICQAITKNLSENKLQYHSNTLGKIITLFNHMPIDNLQIKVAFAQAILNGLFDKFDQQKQPEYITLLKKMKIIDVNTMVPSQNTTNVIKDPVCIFLIENLNNNPKAQQSGNSNTNFSSTEKISKYITQYIISIKNISSFTQSLSSQIILNDTTLKLLFQSFEKDILIKYPKALPQVIELFEKITVNNENEQNYINNINKFFAEILANTKIAKDKESILQIINLLSTNAEKLPQEIANNSNNQISANDEISIHIRNFINDSEGNLKIRIEAILLWHKLNPLTDIKPKELSESKYNEEFNTAEHFNHIDNTAIYFSEILIDVIDKIAKEDENLTLAKKIITFLNPKKQLLLKKEPLYTICTNFIEILNKFITNVKVKELTTQIIGFLKTHVNIFTNDNDTLNLWKKCFTDLKNKDNLDSELKNQVSTFIDKINKIQGLSAII